MITEIIWGQPIGKANNYQAVPDGQGGKRIIKNEKIRAYERSFNEQCKIYRDRGISRPFRLHITVYESSNAYDLDNCSSACPSATSLQSLASSAASTTCSRKMLNA